MRSAATVTSSKSGWMANVRSSSEWMMPDHFSVCADHGKDVLPGAVGDLLNDDLGGGRQLERDVGAIADDDVAGAQRLERVEDEVVPVRGRLALGRQLRVVERALAQRDERDAFGEHQRHEQVVAAGELADHDERADRGTCAMPP